MLPIFKNLWAVQIITHLKAELILWATRLQLLHYILILTSLANLISPYSRTRNLCSSLLHTPCTFPTPSLCPCYTSHLYGTLRCPNRLSSFNPNNFSKPLHRRLLTPSSKLYRHLFLILAFIHLSLLLNHMDILTFQIA